LCLSSFSSSLSLSLLLSKWKIEIGFSLLLLEEEPWHDSNFFSVLLRVVMFPVMMTIAGFFFFFEIQFFVFFSDAHSSDIRFAFYLMMEKSWIAKKRIVLLQRIHSGSAFMMSLLSLPPSFNKCEHLA
jgi:hypothetical protein